MNRYPERDALALRADLARYLGHGLTADQVWAANGSNEVMLHVLQAFGGPGRTVLSFAPTYSMYPEYARDTHTALDRPSRAATTSPSTRSRRVAAIERDRPGRRAASTSPNNPTGTALSPRHRRGDRRRRARRRGGRRGLLRVRPRPARRARWSCCRDHPRLAVSRTMSKAFAFAGGRLGYLAAAPAFVDALRIVRLPYHLSAVTQAVARVALAHADEMLAAVDRLRAARDDLAGLAGRARAARSPTPTPTSCCSAGSPTGTPSGRLCSTGAC